MPSSNPRILVVDDETEIVLLFERFLAKHDYEVLTARDGTEAQKKLAGGAELIISDIRMPRMDGFELARWCRENHPGVPFIMMSAFANDKDEELAKIMGARKLLIKPIDGRALIDLIHEVIPQTVSYGRVPLEEFMAGKKLAATLYACDEDGKISELAHVGEEVTKDKQHAWKSNGVHEVWLKIEDFDKYVETNRKLIRVVAESKSMPSDHRSAFLRHALSVLYENFRTRGVTAGTVASAEAALEECLDILDTGPAITRLLEEAESAEQKAYAHPAICAILCAVMAKVMGWSSRKHIIHLALAGYVHDVGLLALPIRLQAKDPKAMIPDDLKIYRTHPQIGSTQLRGAGCPDEIVMTAWQHHEDDRGTGYPRRLSRVEIFPMIRLVGLVDQFCEEVLRHPPAERKELDKVLMKVVDGNQIDFEKTAILALQLALYEPNLVTARQAYLRQG